MMNKKDTYKKLFKEYFLISFSSRLAEYTNPEIDVFDKEVLSEKYTIVNSLLKQQMKDQKIKLTGEFIQKILKILLLEI